MSSKAWRSIISRPGAWSACGKTGAPIILASSSTTPAAGRCRRRCGPSWISSNNQREYPDSRHGNMRQIEAIALATGDAVAAAFAGQHLMRKTKRHGADGIETPYLVGGETDGESRQGIIELGLGARPEDRDQGCC